MNAVKWRQGQLFDQSQPSPVAGLQSAHGNRCTYLDTALRKIKKVVYPFVLMLSSRNLATKHDHTAYVLVADLRDKDGLLEER